MVENISIGKQIGTLSAIDPNAGDVVTFTLPVGLGDNNAFSLVGNSLRTATSLNFESKATYSITVRATDSGGLFSEQTLTISVINLAELAAPVQIGNGTASRSNIRQLVIDFDSDVIIDNDAFLLQKRIGSGSSATLDTVISNFALTTLASGATRATLSFSGGYTNPGGALSDGYYQLTILGASIRLRSNNQPFDGDSNGVAAGDYVLGAQPTDQFFALYGDTNGDGLVGVAEFGQFRSTFGKTSLQPGYDGAFDFDNDGTVGVADFGQFRSRFGRPALAF